MESVSRVGYVLGGERIYGFPRFFGPLIPFCTAAVGDDVLFARRHDEIRAGVDDRRVAAGLYPYGASERIAGKSGDLFACLAERAPSRRDFGDRLAVGDFFRFDYDRKYFRDQRDRKSLFRRVDGE